MINKTPIAAALLALGTATVSLPSLAGELEDRIAELERQLELLKAEVVGSRDVISSNTVKISANEQQIEEVRPAKKGTRFQYGGFVQMDALSTNYSEGKPSSTIIDDLLVASLIPVESASGDSDSYRSTNLHAKSSRFFFKTDTDTDAGKLSTHIEMDFILSGNDGDERISNSWNSRLRHAYVKWDYDKGSSLLAGQSWSTFFNVSALPDLLDFVGPVGTIFERQPQVRWTSGGLQLAVENATTRLNRNLGGELSSPIDDFHDGLPDLVARYNGKTGSLNWSVAGLGRELSYEDAGGAGDSQFAYGLSLSGKWMLGDDDLRLMFSYGDGLGRYLGLNAFNDGYVDASGDIDTIDQWGAVVAYRHFWSPQWRSTFSVATAGADNPGVTDFIHAESLAKTYQSFHANLNYLPAPNLSVGGELLYASKELEDGRDGDLSRLQFAIKYDF